MITSGRRNDPTDPWSVERGTGGPGAGSLLLAALLGVGVGLLAAPQPGTKTRKQLLQRLAALGEDLGEGLEDVNELSARARKRARRRLAKLREAAAQEREEVQDRLGKARRRVRDEMDQDDEDSGGFGKVVAMLAGLAATYFLTSERAAPARSRVQDVATTVGRRATDQWDRFQRGGIRSRRDRADAGEGRSETRTGSTPSEEAPQAS